MAMVLIAAGLSPQLNKLLGNFLYKKLDFFVIFYIKHGEEEMDWLNGIPAKMTENGRALLLPVNETKDLVRDINPGRLEEIVESRAAENFRGVI